VSFLTKTKSRCVDPSGCESSSMDVFNLRVVQLGCVVNRIECMCSVHMCMKEFSWQV